MAEGNTNTDEDVAKVEGFLAERVKEYFAEEVKSLREEFKGQSGNTPSPTPEDPHKALRDYINPVIQPELQRVRIEAADSADLLKVMNDPMYAEYKEEVETIFNNLKREGRPFSRVDILNHVMGKEFRENNEKFTERTAKVKKSQLDRLNGASDVGGGNIGRNGGEKTFPSMDEFRKLSSKDMEPYLEGVTF